MGLLPGGSLLDKETMAVGSKYGVGVLLAAAVLAAPMLTACGSSGGGDSPSGEIVVGNIGSYSGPTAATNAGSREVLDAWAKSVNAAGGIDGHKIKLVVKDDANSPTQALNAVKALVEQEHAVAVVGLQSDADQAFATYVKAKGIPVVGGVNITTTFASNPYFFPSGTTIMPMIYGSVGLAKEQGKKNLGYIYCAESPLCAQTAPLYKSIGASLGMSFKYGAKASGTAPDYTAPCLAAKKAGVDALSVGFPSPVVLRIASECAQQGYEPELVTTAPSVDAAWLKNPAVDGTVAAGGPFPWFDTSPATKEYRDALANYAPDLVKNSGGGTGAANAWTAGKLFEAAVKASGAKTVTSAGIMTGLYKLHDETLGGIAPPLNYVKGKPTNITCYFTIGIENGKFTEPSGLKTSCVPPDGLKALGIG